MPALILAQVALPSTLGGWALLVVCLAAVAAIVLVAVRAMGIQISGWMVQIGWIVVVAAVALAAIHLVLTLARG